MEIERKYLLKEMPEDLSVYSCLDIEQAYLCRNPVVRVRKQDEEYYLTYKSNGLMVREEYNLPLSAEAYVHLRQKADGRVITKKRYLIPLSEGLKVELDIFEGAHAGTVLAEVEFPDEERAKEFVPPEWFGEEVTFDERYHNSRMSQM